MSYDKTQPCKTEILIIDPNDVGVRDALTWVMVDAELAYKAAAGCLILIEPITDYDLAKKVLQPAIARLRSVYVTNGRLTMLKVQSGGWNKGRGLTVLQDLGNGRTPKPIAFATAKKLQDVEYHGNYIRL